MKRSVVSKLPSLCPYQPGPFEMNFLAWTPVPNEPTKDTLSAYSTCWRWLDWDPSSTAVPQCVEYSWGGRREVWIAALHLR